MQTFEWDEAKAATNYRKHGIRFQLAIRAFDDPFAVVTQDRVVDGEARWQTLGLVDGLLLLLVAHTVRHEIDAEVIRIISARKPSQHERKRYENG